MQSVRVQPVSAASEKLLLIDVVCDCGSNGLMDKTTGDSSFKHPVVLGSSEAKTLVCVTCKKEYTVLAQSNHLHINQRPPIDDKILFYEGEWYIFSNFSSFMVFWHGVNWTTAEHAYQAAKFDDPEIAEKIRVAGSAYDAKKVAHAHQNEVRWDWDDDKKLEIMEEIVRAKLTQHPYIQRKLLQTGKREIVENSPRDSFWGRGPDWKGRNELGKLWMKLRTER
ncbi:MAG: NADAR family protein [Candidatus Sungbacteria bacterium]|nr:NADAR family protein [Candidatus Sungbacteria bacterium]